MIKFYFKNKIKLNVCNSERSLKLINIESECFKITKSFNSKLKINYFNKHITIDHTPYNNNHDNTMNQLLTKMRLFPYCIVLTYKYHRYNPLNITDNIIITSIILIYQLMDDVVSS